MSTETTLYETTSFQKVSDLNPKAQVFNAVNLNLNKNKLNPNASIFYPNNLVLDCNIIHPCLNSDENLQEESISILDITPHISEINTPDISFDHGSINNAIFDLIDDMLPAVREIVLYTRVIASFGAYVNFCGFNGFCYFIYIISLRLVFALVLDPNCEGEFVDFSDVSFRDLSTTDSELSELLSDPSSENLSGSSDIEENNANQVLLDLRKKNVNNVIIGTLNINSVASKLDQLRVIIGNYIDILTIQETKLDDTVPTADLMINGYSEPYRLDRNHHGGGVLIYVREDIPSKPLDKHSFKGVVDLFYVFLFRPIRIFITYPSRIL